MINKITIIGVGLIGGSLAKALKEKNLAKNVFGFGRDHSRLEEAKKCNIIDNYSTDIEEAVNQADIIVIATPVGTFQNIFNEVKPLIDDNVIISDVGSTKTNIVDIAKEVLGAKSQCFVPAHPIAGKEKSGFEIELERSSDFEVEPYPLPENKPLPSQIQAQPQEETLKQEEKKEPQKLEVKEGYEITSPMVGTFYASSSPDDDPFIKVGDSVTEETVVCIIEAMKVMNEVKAGKKGTVAEVCLESAHPVEFGTKLFRIV